MAKVFMNHGVLGFRTKQDDESGPGAVSAGATDVIAFDDDSNSALITDLRKSSDGYSIVDGVLQKNGAPVTIAADTPEKQQRDGFDAGIAAAIADCDTIIGLPSPASAVQLTVAAKALAQQNKRIIRLIAQLRKLQR